MSSVQEFRIESGPHIEKLLEANADPDQKDNQGRSPLWAAAQQDHSQAVELLIKSGAYIDQKENVEGMTPLMGAAVNGRSGRCRNSPQPCGKCASHL